MRRRAVMITIAVDDIRVEVDPAEFGVEMDRELALAIANELEEVLCGALAKIRDGIWTDGHDCDRVWRLVELEEALADPAWASRAISRAVARSSKSE
jgi:hypothetical protein